MQSWSIGVFASIDAGLGVKLEVVRDLGIKTIQLHTPHKTSRTPENAAVFSKQLANYGIVITTVFLGFEGESYETIDITAKTVGFVPPTTRSARLTEAFEISDFAKLLEVSAIGSHIGFVPHDRISTDYKEVVETIRCLCDHLAKNNQTLHLETGQESVDSLLAFISDVQRNNLFINFDPANLILYGIGDPIGALKTVGQYVRGVHCKDAVATTGKPGVDWGREVPFGTGQINAELFLQTLHDIGYRGALTIEREIPEEPQRQKEEIGQAVQLITQLKTKILNI
ncbi:MAG: sugar phosphate isomerase/epimerase [Planctomycetaceae bacterium]|jgi:sugar phosphate isomerase/epimerase|nr:sugar phosphate isomerase/epimerase [Planctomycetaceae bacterium]